MQRFFIALALMIAAGCGARADGPTGPGLLPNVKLGPLPFPSYWVSNRGAQLKIYAFDAKPVAGTKGHGYFTGVLSSPAAPPGCQYQTFEMRGEYFIPQIAFAVTWKNWTADCGAQTSWIGILDGNRLQLEWMLSKRNAHGDFVPTGQGGIEIFQQQP